MSASSKPSGELSFEKLKELDALFDRQLKNTQVKTTKTGGSTSTLSLKKWLGFLLLLMVCSLLPFLVLVRTSVFVYERYALNGRPWPWA